MCPQTNEWHLAGEDCRKTSTGMFLIATNSESPFASGQWPVQKTPISIIRRDPFYDRIDAYGKLDSKFNYVDSYKKAPNGPMAAVPSSPNAEHVLNNRIRHHEYELDGGENRFHFGDLPDIAGSTERWRQNDKFILVENPLTLTSNNSTKQTIVFQHQHSSSSSDDFKFPKVTYIS